MLEYICTRCNYIGTKQRIGIQSPIWRALYRMSLVSTMGLTYILRLMFFRQYGCPKCGETTMVTVRPDIERRRYEANLCDEENLRKDLVNTMMENDSFVTPEMLHKKDKNT